MSRTDIIKTNLQKHSFKNKRYSAHTGILIGTAKIVVCHITIPTATIFVGAKLIDDDTKKKINAVGRTSKPLEQLNSRRLSIHFHSGTGS
jgi:hypothetical protein